MVIYKSKYNFNLCRYIFFCSLLSLLSFVVINVYLNKQFDELNPYLVFYIRVGIPSFFYVLIIFTLDKIDSFEAHEDRIVIQPNKLINRIKIESIYYSSIRSVDIDDDAILLQFYDGSTRSIRVKGLYCVNKFGVRTSWQSLYRLILQSSNKADIVEKLPVPRKNVVSNYSIIGVLVTFLLLLYIVKYFISAYK